MKKVLPFNFTNICKVPECSSRWKPFEQMCRSFSRKAAHSSQARHLTRGSAINLREYVNICSSDRRLFSQTFTTFAAKRTNNRTCLYKYFGGRWFRDLSVTLIHVLSYNIEFAYEQLPTYCNNKWSPRAYTSNRPDVAREILREWRSVLHSGRGPRETYYRPGPCSNRLQNNT